MSVHVDDLDSKATPFQFVAGMGNSFELMEDEANDMTLEPAMMLLDAIMDTIIDQEDEEDDEGAAEQDRVEAGDLLEAAVAGVGGGHGERERNREAGWPHSGR